MSRRLAIVAGAIAASILAAALPVLAARSPLLRQAVRWLDPRLPPLLFAVAIAGGAAAALRSRWKPAGLVPGRAEPRGSRLWPVLGPAAAMTVFMVPLLAVWIGVPSDGCSVFGLLPWSDAGDYYRGAQDLLETGTLDTWNCRRPLNAALLAVRLAVAGQSLQGAQAIQVALLCLAAYALSWTLAKDFGWPAGLLAFALLFTFSRPFLHWFTSECLGLTLGALAFAVLWTGARSGRTAVLFWGMALLTLALDARAGAFLVLPALVLWAGLSDRGGRRFRWGVAASCLAGILLGTLANASIMKLYGGRFGVGHGNFSLVLYGLATGKPGWTQIYRDYPETRAMSEDAINDFAYERSYRDIAQDPSRLPRSLALVSKAFVSGFPFYFTRGWSLVPWTFVRWMIVLFFGGGLILFLVRFRRRREVSMVLASLAGFLLSVPILWVDGGDRVYAATVPLFAILLAFGMRGWGPAAGNASNEAAPRDDSRGVRLIACAGAILLATAAAGPVVARRLGHEPPKFSPPGGGERESVVIFAGDPGVDVSATNETETSFVPRLRRVDYLLNLPAFAKEDFGRLPKPGAVYYARDRLVSANEISPRKYVWVVGPGGMAGEQPRYLLLRGTYRRETNVFIVSDYTTLPGAPDRSLP